MSNFIDIHAAEHKAEKVKKGESKKNSSKELSNFIVQPTNVLAN